MTTPAGSNESLSHAHALFVKENALRLADDHRVHCTGRDCGISLNALHSLLRMAGFELNDDEVWRLF